MIIQLLKNPSFQINIYRSILKIILPLGVAFELSAEPKVKKFDPDQSRITFSVNSTIGQSSGKIAYASGTLTCSDNQCLNDPKVSLTVPVNAIKFDISEAEGFNLSALLKSLLVPYGGNQVTLNGVIVRDRKSIGDKYKLIGTSVFNGVSEKVSQPVKIQKIPQNHGGYSVMVTSNYSNDGEIEIPGVQTYVDNHLVSSIKIVFR